MHTIVPSELIAHDLPAFSLEFPLISKPSCCHIEPLYLYILTLPIFVLQLGEPMHTIVPSELIAHDLPAFSLEIPLISVPNFVQTELIYLYMLTLPLGEYPGEPYAIIVPSELIAHEVPAVSPDDPVISAPICDQFPVPILSELKDGN